MHVGDDLMRVSAHLARGLAICQPACPPLGTFVGNVRGDCAFNVDGGIEAYGGSGGGGSFMFFNLTWRRG